MSTPSRRREPSAGASAAAGQSSLPAEIGGRIRARRQQLGLTRGTVARRLGRPAATVTAWESGQSMPDIAELLDMAAVLGTRAGALLGEAIAPAADPGGPAPDGGDPSEPAAGPAPPAVDTGQVTPGTAPTAESTGAPAPAAAPAADGGAGITTGSVPCPCVQAAAVEPAEAPPTAEVCIKAPGYEVSVKGNGSAQEIGDEALRLLREVAPPAQRDERIGLHL